MKKALYGLIMAMVAMSGCAKSELIKANSISTRDELSVKSKGVIAQGFADLRISSSLKTHSAGAVSAKSDIHGTPEYKLVVKIDDQPVPLEAMQRRESNEGRGLHDAEAGQGIRYDFKTQTRIKAGTHKVVVEIPADSVTVEREIIAADGSTNYLVIEPVYRWAPAKQRPPANYGRTSYEGGIRQLNIIFNDKVLD